MSTFLKLNILAIVSIITLVLIGWSQFFRSTQPRSLGSYSDGAIQDNEKREPIGKPVTFKSKEEACRYLSSNEWSYSTTANATAGERTAAVWTLHSTGEFKYVEDISDLYGEDKGRWLIADQDGEFILAVFSEDFAGLPASFTKYKFTPYTEALELKELTQSVNETRLYRKAEKLSTASSACRSDKEKDVLLLNHYETIRNAWSNNSFKLKISNRVRMGTHGNQAIINARYLVRPVSDNSGILELDGTYRRDEGRAHSGSAQYSYEFVDDKTLKLDLVTHTFKNVENEEFLEDQKTPFSLTLEK